MAQLSAEERLELTVRVKDQLRKRMRQLRRALPAEAVAARSARIVASVQALPEYRDARAIALFYPIAGRNEVDLRELDATARADGKRVYYPFMDPQATGFSTGFRRVDQLAQLVERGRGFLEPTAGEPAGPSDVDLVLVPALAVTESGDRLGYGIGFYDVTLSDVRPPARAWIVAFDFQLIVELPHEPHDVRCDGVVTDSRTLRC